MASNLSLENGDYYKRSAPKLQGLALVQLSFQALGIIYSDVGTSPLYTINGIWPSSGSPPSKEDVIGGISAIIWSLTLLALIKYVIISLFFGTREGEGGPFALYQGLYPPDAKEPSLERTLTRKDRGDKVTKRAESRIKNTLQWPLLVWCLFGTALTMADGIFTPAVSVTSAVGGIAVAKPSVEKDIVPISIAFLVVLFMVQQYGTARLAGAFAPVATLWFLFLIGTGIYNITTYPGIFRAFDPSRAIMLFVRTGDYDILTGVILALTGCEAVFANLGQFNAASIRISFTCLVYPALILAYLGQGARLIVDGENVIQNVFYKSIPGPENGALFWIMFTLAILATLIASQSLITATFSLFQQVINMKSFPPLRMLYTSETIQGQVYVPAVNWALMVIIIIVVAVFSNLANMTNAYGFAVATVMFSTSVLLAVHMYYVKGWPIYVPIAYFLFFGFIDGLFWGASLKKVPHGAWVPLMIGAIMMIVMVFWTWAKGLEDAFDGANRQNLRNFIHRDDKTPVEMYSHETTDSDVAVEKGDGSDTESMYYLAPVRHLDSESMEGKEGSGVEKRALARIPTFAVFHKLTDGRGVPHTFVGFVRQWPALPEILVFLSVRLVPMARVAPEDRYLISKMKSIDGFYSVTYHIGFRERFDVKIDELAEKICAVEMQANPESSSRIVKKIKAIAANATHVVPHYHAVSRPGSGTSFMSLLGSQIRRYLIEDIYMRLATLFPETANWLTSADEIIHVGINAVI